MVRAHRNRKPCSRLLCRRFVELLGTAPTDTILVCDTRWETATVIEVIAAFLVVDGGGKQRGCAGRFKTWRF